MYKGFLSIFILLFLFACTFEDQYVESDIDNFVKSQTRFALLDTFSVNLESVQIDSVETAGAENLLVGKYNDPEFGKVSASAYFNLSLPSDATVDDKEEYDECYLVLTYGDLVYGDTLQAQTIKVHRLLEDIVDSDDNPLYNTTTRKYDTTPLGEVSVIAEPAKDDTLRIKINDELGLELFNKLKDEDEEVSSSDDFLEYFKGLVLVAGEENTAVFSFAADTSINLVLCSHISAQVKEEYSHVFSLSTTTSINNFYNHFEDDRNGLPTDLLLTQKSAITSALTDDKAYIKGGTGVVARLNFPSLGRLLEFDGSNMMYKAELVLRPYPNSDDAVPLPESLMLYYTDKYNNLLSEVTDEDDNTVTSVMYSDEYYDENLYYSLDLTAFVYNELSAGYVDEELGLILTIPEDELEGSLSRLVLDARSRSDYRPVLNLYYMFFE